MRARCCAPFARPLPPAGLFRFPFAGAAARPALDGAARAGRPWRRHESDRGSHSRDTRVSASRAPEVAQGTRELRTFRSLVGLGERHVLTEAPHVCGDKTRDTQLSKNMPTSTHATSKCSKSLSLSLWCRAFVRSTPPQHEVSTRPPTFIDGVCAMCLYLSSSFGWCSLCRSASTSCGYCRRLSSHVSNPSLPG